MEIIKTMWGIENIEALSSVFQAIITSFAIFIGGIWAFFRFKRQRENNALIDFNVDIVFHSLLNDYWIVELVAYVENKGKVQHKIFMFDFKLESLVKTSKVEISEKNEEARGQVKFDVIHEGSFMRKKSSVSRKMFYFNSFLYSVIYRNTIKANYYFIEPGLKNKYSYITSVHKNTDILLLHAWFKYPKAKHEHIAEVTKKVPVLK